jgi:sugar lactone lactonase YvrE
MKWLFVVLAACVVATGAVAASGTAAPNALPGPQTIASWPFVQPDGSFAESMAYGSDGHLYVSHTIWGQTDVGEIDRVPLTGGPVRTVATFDAGVGMFTGLAIDERNRMYIAFPSFSDAVPSAIMRVEGSGRLTPVLYLPSSVFPNGLVFHGGYLYVTDALLGVVWRAQLGSKPVTETVPWLSDPALAPVTELGPDGIAFSGSTMYVSQYDRGEILTSVVAPDGSPGPLHVLASDPALVTVDGIAFGPDGNLWVTVNENRLAYVTAAGTVVVVADGVPWLDYPTQVVFGPRGMYVVNGSYSVGAPSVIGWPSP